MRIREGERGVGCERDALSGRRQGSGGARLHSERSCEFPNESEIAMTFGDVSKAPRAQVQVVVLERLHQSEMAFGKMDRLVAGNDPDHRNIECGDGSLNRSAMA